MYCFALLTITAHHMLCFRQLTYGEHSLTNSTYLNGETFEFLSLLTMPRLSQEERARAVGHLQAGVSVQRVAALFNVTRRTIYLWQNRFQATGVLRDLPRSGRRRITTPGEDRHIRTSHLRNRFQTAIETATNFPGRNGISRHTVRRRLRENGITARRPAQRPLLLPRHRIARLQWSRTHLQWTRQQWSTVLFTDESRFLLGTGDGRIRCYRRVNERFSQQCILEIPNRGYGQVMVWGGISRDHRTALVHVTQAMTGTY